ncbi:MAG TPA: PEP-CTERM sorting domain-containing protein [Verrucomicrobiae bacterium]|jgi:hypothetical protein|nr:PEP-CTERM sorting domain-containing protein [Verrucomicrobiae bacterium]
MKSAAVILMAVFGALALSVASSTGQVLDLTGATVVGSLPNQTLINSATSANDGIISTWVVNDPTLDSSGLIFIYQLENGGPDDITGVNFNSYSPSQYISSELYSNVSSGTLSGSITPSVNLHPNFTFDTITGGGAATFNGDLAMGKASWFIAIDTDVTSFNTGYGLSQDDFQAHGDIYAPNAAVYTTPEPSSALMLLVGSACFYAVLRRRRAMDS